MQIRAKCQPHGSIVVVGDVAEVLAADGAQAATLAGVELFPAPPPGQQRVLRVRELEDMLANRGINLAELRFSGSSQTVIGGFGEQASAADLRPMSASAARRAARAVREAIARFLQAQASADETWQVEVKLTDDQTRLIPADEQRISVAGGAPPWTGSQKFEVRVDRAGRPASFSVTATVSQLARVVIAARSISRGETIRSTDLELHRPRADAASGEVFHSIDEVAGMEAAQTVSAGSVIQRSYLRAPIMVRRGEMITVYSRAAGIRIRVTARAREDGALGDLVTVESLADRKAYTARVCGLQEAEVYARAMQPAPAASDAAPWPVLNLARSSRRTMR